MGSSSSAAGGVYESILSRTRSRKLACRRTARREGSRRFWETRYESFDSAMEAMRSICANDIAPLSPKECDAYDGGGEYEGGEGEMSK